MRVRLDAARNDNLPVSINWFDQSAVDGIVETNVGDLLTLDTHQPSPDSLRRDDLAIANQQIQHRYALLAIRCTGA